MLTVESLFCGSQISSWDEARNYPWNSQGNIATETQIEPAAVWQKCIDALLRLWQDPTIAADLDPPNRIAIESAIQWILRLRDLIPMSPPTLITAEPTGGVIVEFRFNGMREKGDVMELTFYNDARAEITLYHNSEVTLMEDIPANPARA